jgi:hypothetical protein
MSLSLFPTLPRLRGCSWRNAQCWCAGVMLVIVINISQLAMDNEVGVGRFASLFQPDRMLSDVA